MIELRIGGSHWLFYRFGSMEKESFPDDFSLDVVSPIPSKL